MKIDNRFRTLSKTSLEIMRALVNVEHTDPDKKVATQRLMKLLYYSSENALTEPYVTLATVREKILNGYVTQVPRIPNETDIEKAMIVITYDAFEKTGETGEYISHAVIIDILVPLNAWLVNTEWGRALRTVMMKAEIFDLLDMEVFEGLGRLEYSRSNSLALTPSLIGYSMIFHTYDSH